MCEPIRIANAHFDVQRTVYAKSSSLRVLGMQIRQRQADFSNGAMRVSLKGRSRSFRGGTGWPKSVSPVDANRDAIGPKKRTPLARGFRSLAICGGASLTFYPNGVVSELCRPTIHAFLLFVIFAIDPGSAFTMLLKATLVPSWEVGSAI
jgi:hypothetical protein